MQHNAGDCHLVSAAAAGRLLHLHVHQQLEQEPQRYLDMYLYLHIYRNYRDIYQPTFIYSATGAEEESAEAEGATHFTAG